MECTKTWKISKEHAAQHLADKGIYVLSTPCLILFMEATTRECLDSTLEPDEATVGYRIDVRHLKPAYLNQKIRIRAKLFESTDTRYLFYIKAYLGETLIGEAIHERRKIKHTHL
ncbi:MAG: hypothetical protein F7C32_00175 [Desulfurococcales archaeon]|nr:hypothetical protein [Desulfurococcales archaeon]